MKFSEISQEDWGALQPCMDTCILPVTGLSGSESPWEATIALEELRDALDLLEIPYKGRVVTYPAFHYSEGRSAQAYADNVCLKLREAGFVHIIVVTTNQELESWALEHADLILYVNTEQLRSDPAETKRTVSREVQQLWKRE